MRFEKPELVESYWYELSQEHGIPARDMLDPRAMSDYLPYVFLADRISHGVARLRVCGNHLSELTGMETKGMHLSAMFGPGAGTTVAAAIDAVCGRPCLADLDLEASPDERRGLLHARMFLAPLTDGSGQVNRILGCIQAKGMVGQLPRQFDWARVGFRNTWEARSHTDAEPQPLRKIAVATQSHPDPVQSNPQKARPYLRLVHSAD